MVLTHLYSTEQTVNEMALCPVLVDGVDHLSYQQLKCLYSCFESIKSFLDVWFSIPATSYMDLPFPIYPQLIRCLITLSKLSTLNDAAWDLKNVRETADFVLILDRICDNLDQAIVQAGPDDKNDNLDLKILYLSKRMAYSFRNAWVPKLRPDNFITPLSSIPTPPSPSKAPFAYDIPEDIYDSDWLTEFLLPSNNG